jgi:hypothetical protein
MEYLLSRGCWTRCKSIRDRGQADGSVVIGFFQPGPMHNRLKTSVAPLSECESLVKRWSGVSAYRLVLKHGSDRGDSVEEAVEEPLADE